VIVSLDEATELRDTFNDMHPEFRRAIRIESARVRDQRSTGEYYVLLVNGRKNGIFSYELDRDFDEETGKPVGPVKGMHKAFNRRVQGSIGEFAKAWMVLADEFLMNELRWGREGAEAHGLLLQIHDALMISVPDDPWGEELAKQVRQIGIDLWDQWFSIPDASNPGQRHAVSGDIDLNRWNQK
jgi:DNA polymerase I-like protein with 3'-5' exonuclease and polymerase domains